MMPAPGEYSDTLRALGRFLEMVGASEISVVDDGDNLEVSWRGRSSIREERRYKEFELHALRTTARLFRGIDGGTPPLTPSEVLRTLGQELDKVGARDIGLVETSDGFYVSAHVNGERFRRLYRMAELLASAREQHAARLAEQTGALRAIPAAASSTMTEAPVVRIPATATSPKSLVGICVGQRPQDRDGESSVGCPPERLSTRAFAPAFAELRGARAAIDRHESQSPVGSTALPLPA